MTTDEIWKLLEVFGPPVLAVVGAVCTLVFSALAGLLRWAWGKHQRRMGLMAEALTELAQAVRSQRESHEAEDQRLWDAVQGVRAEVALAARSSDSHRAGMLSLEGAIKAQTGTLNSYIERMGKMEGKFEAIFRFMDAPRRASDSGRG